jgi:hypothetical protein
MKKSRSFPCAAQAVAENIAGQTANFLLGVLGACASTYPVAKKIRAVAQEMT